VSRFFNEFFHTTVIIRDEIFVAIATLVARSSVPSRFAFATSIKLARSMIWIARITLDLTVRARVRVVARVDTVNELVHYPSHVLICGVAESPKTPGGCVETSAQKHIHEALALIFTVSKPAAFIRRLRRDFQIDSRATNQLLTVLKKMCLESVVAIPRICRLPVVATIRHRRQR
jgi:hypothetical protein|tara:strand:- start:7411 stop:7935 length:525 start_codon:yes stop_codon:yes gene_type:complete